MDAASAALQALSQTLAPTTDSPFPTFLELYAEECLTPSLMAVFRYCFTLLAERSSRLARCHTFLDEIQHFTWFFVELLFVSLYDATFAENFFSMRRRKYISEEEEATTTTSDNSQHHKQLLLLQLRSLDKNDKLWTVFSQLGTSYLLLKMDSDHLKWKEEDLEQQQQQQQQHQQFHIYNNYNNNISMMISAVFSDVVRVFTDRRRGSSSVSFLPIKNLLLLFRHLFHSKVYDILRASWEAVIFLHYLLHLFERTRYFTPLLRMRQLLLCRLTSKDMNEWQRKPPRIQILNLTRFSLLFLFISFKIFEWCRDHSTGASMNLPVPPPPPPPHNCVVVNDSSDFISSSSSSSSPAGGVLHRDPRVCSICSNVRVNPTMLDVSGNVFCYTCIHKYVQDKSCCPVTGFPATLSSLRRIYESI